MTAPTPTSERERPTVQEVASLFRHAAEHGARITMHVGDLTVAMPEELAATLGRVVDLVAAGQPVEIEGLPPVLTTGQAADLLGVSRPTVVTLIDEGILPAERMSTHRRIRTEDLLAYRAARTHSRSAALDDIVAISEDLGLYDD
jgi:excisionase family DNA binding protein